MNEDKQNFKVGKVYSKLMLPTELLLEFPQIKKVWNAQQLGFLLKCKMIKGKKTLRSSLLDVPSVLKAFHFYEQTIYGEYLF